jgi:prevent-host-death family protein
MPRVVNVHAAKTHLSRLIDEVAEGREIVIARAGRPVARLAPLEARPVRRKPGLLRGRITIARNFDAPLPTKLLEAFYCGALEPRRRRG